MPLLSAYVGPTEKISPRIDKVIRKLGKDVVRVIYKFDEDSTGDPCIYFRVVLTDEATKGDRLFETTTRVKDALRSLSLFANWGLLSYFNFRSESEHGKLKDPDWA